jgi:DNA-directed RNA polymerase beta' subunit
MQSFEIQKNVNSTTPFFKKKFLKGYSKIHELKLVSVGLASPEKIQSWAEKELPNGKIFGEVTNANTFHYRTFQPTKGGLFCERIFGPLKDFECACGKRQKPTALESKKILEHKQTTRYFCSNCDVEYTWSIIRRYQLGYIKLNAPVTHLWYLKTNPSYLSIFFDMKRKDLEAVVYCTDSLTLENVWKYSEQKTNFYNSISDLYNMWLKFKNFKEKKNNFEKKFLNQKQKKGIERQKFLSHFKEKLILKRKTNEEKFLEIYKRKTTFLKNNELFSAFQFQNLKEENLSPVQLQIFQTVQNQKNQILFSFFFEKILRKNFKKTYGNFLLKNFLKQFFSGKSRNAKNQKTQLELYKKCFFPNSFFDKNFSENNKDRNLFFLFSFLFNFSNSLVFSLKSSQKFLKNTDIFTKRNSIFLLIIVSFLKKEKTLEIFLSKKKENLRSQLYQFFPSFFLQLTQNDSYSYQKNFFANFQNSEEQNALFQNSEKIFVSCIGKVLLSLYSSSLLSLQTQHKNEDKKKFLLYPYEKYTQKFLFFTKKKNFLSRFKKYSFEKTVDVPIAPQNIGEKQTFFQKESKSNFSFLTGFDENSQKKSILQVCNKSIDFQNKRISQKKQKKRKEFLRSGFVIENLEKDMKFKNETTHELPFQYQKMTNSKKSFCFSLRRKGKKNFSSFSQRKNIHSAKELNSTIDMDKMNSQKTKLQMLQKKNGKTEKSKMLKNPILTISYNFLWKNDSDWKYFVYYNSLFLSEFEDIPTYEPLQTSFSSGDKISRTKNQYFTILEGVDKNFTKQTQVGAGIVERLLAEYTPIELKKMIKQHQILLPKINKVIHSSKQLLATPKKESLKIQKYIQKREHIVRRLKFLRKFFRKNSNPTFMILRNLPVLPPDLRPILKLQNQIAASDLNRFYQRIIYRNERLKKFSKDSATNQSFELRYAQRLLQEAVDNLIQNGKGGVKPETNSRGIPLKSLSEVLKGKQGRFRQYLLGKRVDYSGRSVIVVGPKLKLYECGLPKEMAFELFLPFLIQQILQLSLSKTVIGAKNILKKDSTLAFHLLKKIMKNIPVLLNRAPTLHRLGFQAFLPKLIEGRAILLHPMVCPGFNADFDGDQMAVHVPLTVEARTEAWKFMLSTNNFINSATGDPVLLPTQDMVLGLYYLTTDFQSKSAAVQILNSLRKEKNTKFYDFQKKNKNFSFFSNFSDVLSAYQRKEISLHSPIWVRWNGFVDFGNDSIKSVEIQVRKNGDWQQITPKITTFSNQKNEIFSKFIRTTPGRIFMNFIIREFQNK